MLLFLSFLLSPDVKLSLFESFLCSLLIELGLTVISSFLKISESLDFLLLLGLDAEIFSQLGLFTLDLLLVKLSNIVVDTLLNRTGSLLLIQSILVCNFDFLIHSLNSLLLLSDFSLVLESDLLNIGSHLSFLGLVLLLNFHTDFLTFLDLVNDDLSTALTSMVGSVFSVHFAFDSLQTLDLHHHVESLLLQDPVLFKHLVFIELTVTDRADFGSHEHLVHVLDIIVLLVHLVLNLGQQSVLTVILSFHLKRSVGLSFSVLSLHALLASFSGCHSRLSLLTHNGALLLGLSLVLDKDILFHTVDVSLRND